MKSRLSRVLTLAGMALAVAFSTASTAQEARPAAAAAASPKCAAPKPPPTGLEKKDLAEGTGRVVKFRTAVLAHYTGWLYDGCAPDLKGTEFDSSRGRPTPFGFVVGAGRVIKGWDEGVLGMKEKGSKRLLVIPAHLGYGDRTIGDGKIPANSTLVFEVEIVDIVYQPPDEPAKQ